MRGNDSAGQLRRLPRKLLIFKDLTELARRAGLELAGMAQGLDLSQPADQWVPTPAVQVHQLQVVDFKDLKSETHLVSRTALSIRQDTIDPEASSSPVLAQRPRPHAEASPKMPLCFGTVFLTLTDQIFRNAATRLAASADLILARDDPDGAGRARDEARG